MTIDDVVSIMENLLSSKERRHVVGGVLISLSLLFGGLAVTTITLKGEY